MPYNDIEFLSEIQYLYNEMKRAPLPYIVHNDNEISIFLYGR